MIKHIISIIAFLTCMALAMGGYAETLCARKENASRKYKNTESKSFEESEKTRLKELADKIPNFLFNMDMVFMRVDKWSLDPENPGSYQSGGMIVLTDKFFRMSQEEQERVLKHELGHQWHEENLALVQEFLKVGWNVKDGKIYTYEDLKGNAAISSKDKAPSRKDNNKFPRRPEDKNDPPYSATNPLEDFGVSLELYLNNPDSLKKQSPERYKWMTKNIPQDTPTPKAEQNLLLNGQGTKWYDCPTGWVIAGAYYVDDDTKSDDSVEKIRCSQIKARDNREVQCKIAKSNDLQMNGLGTKWYYCPDGYAVSGAYYNDSDDHAVEQFRCSKIVAQSRGKACDVVFHDDHKVVQMNGEGTQWNHCPEGYVVTGGSYEDDDTVKDDSVVQLQCTRISVTCQ